MKEREVHEDSPVKEVHLDHLVHRDFEALMEPQVLMVLQEHLDQREPLDTKVHLDLLAYLDREEYPDPKGLKEAEEILDFPDPRVK